MKLILHPGHSKCGSTLIQSWLYKNVKGLFTSGYLQLDDNLNGIFDVDKSFKRYSQNNYFSNVLFNQAFDTLESDLISAIDSGYQHGLHTIIISCETLAFQNYHGLEPCKHIYNLLNRIFDDVKVAYYVRRQDDFVLSAWQQWYHKEGMSLNQAIDFALDRHIPDFKLVAGSLCEEFGKSNIHIRPINRQALLEYDLITDFNVATGIKLNNDDRKNLVSNQAINPILCEILSKIPDAYSGSRDNRLRSRLSNHIDNFNLLYKRHDSLLSELQRNKILSAFKVDNTYLFHHFFNHLSLEELYFIQDVPILSENQKLEHELDRTKEILALQFEYIINLSKKLDSLELHIGSNSKPTNNTPKSLIRIKQLLKRVLNKF